MAQQGDQVLFEVKWLIGAATRPGQTSAVRVLACGAALDPIADLWVHEHAGKGDTPSQSRAGSAPCKRRRDAERLGIGA